MNADIRDAVAVAVRTGPRRALDKIREVSGRTALIAVLCACTFTVTVSMGVKKSAVQLSAAQTPRTPADRRPDLSRCPDTIPLWDCIRHADYLEEKQWLKDDTHARCRSS